MKKKKRAVTLIEIMIVILLIGLIGGALAFNMRGSLDQGKVFKTEQAQLRIYEILTLEATKEGLPLEAVVHDWRSLVQHSPLVKKGTEFMQDAWHKPFIVKIEDGDIVVKSPGLEKYKETHAKK